MGCLNRRQGGVERLSLVRPCRGCAGRRKLLLAHVSLFAASSLRPSSPTVRLRRASQNMKILAIFPTEGWKNQTELISTQEVAPITAGVAFFSLKAELVFLSVLSVLCF